MLRPTSYSDDLQWLPALNREDRDAIPAFALMSVTQVGEAAGPLNFSVTRPTMDSGRIHLINGPAPIDPGLVGLGTFTRPVQVLYDDRDGAPAAGEEWGAKAGEWKLRKAMRGYLILGGANAATARVWVVHVLAALGLAWIRTTSTTATAGRYPAVIDTFNGSAWTLGTSPVWAVPSGGIQSEPLPLGRWLGLFAALAPEDSLPVYVVFDGVGVSGQLRTVTRAECVGTTFRETSELRVFRNGWWVRTI